MPSEARAGADDRTGTVGHTQGRGKPGRDFRAASLPPLSSFPESD